MRLDHLLSREITEAETQRFIPRSMLTVETQSVKEIQTIQSGAKRHDAVSAFRSVSFSGFGEPGEARAEKPTVP